MMLGTYPDYTVIQDIDVEHGAFFDMTAVKNASTYAVIGPDTARELGLPENPVGEIIRIQNMPFVTVQFIVHQWGHVTFTVQLDALSPTIVSAFCSPMASSIVRFAHQAD